MGFCSVCAFIITTPPHPTPTETSQFFALVSVALLLTNWHHVTPWSLTRLHINWILQLTCSHFIHWVLCQCHLYSTWLSKLIFLYRLLDFGLQDWHWALDDIDDDCSSIHFWWAHRVKLCAVCAMLCCAVQWIWWQCFHETLIGLCGHSFNLQWFFSWEWNTEDLMILNEVQSQCFKTLLAVNIYFISLINMRLSVVLK